MTLSKRNRAYFNVAKEMSKLSDFPRVHIGCCVVYKHKVISTGYNTQRGDPIQKKINVYRFNDDVKHCAHAEVMALKPLIGRKDIEFKNVELYLYREYKNGELAMSKPCASCNALIRSLGVRYIYYTGNQSYICEENVY